MTAIIGIQLLSTPAPVTVADAKKPQQWWMRTQVLRLEVVWSFSSYAYHKWVSNKIYVEYLSINNCHIDVPIDAGPLDAAYQNAMGGCNCDCIALPATNFHLPRLVYSMLCAGNISFKFVYCISNTKNRPGIRSLRKWW